MRGDIFATISMILIYGMVYMLTLYCLWFLFSKGIKYSFSSRRNESIAVLASLAALFFLAPFLTGILFKVGVIIEENSGKYTEGGILWGCAIEYAILAGIGLFVLSFVALTIVLLIAMIKPQWFKFHKRINIVIVFIVQNVIAFLLPFQMEKVILYMLEFAHGINASCM
jgi:hypothetical protein